MEFMKTYIDGAVINEPINNHKVVQSYYHIVFNYKRLNERVYYISTIRFKDYGFDQQSFSNVLQIIIKDYGLTKDDEINILSWQKFDKDLN